MPTVLPVTEMQRNSASLTDQAIKTKEPIYLTRHGKLAVVLIDAEEFDRRMAYRDAIIRHEESVLAGIMRGHEEVKRGDTVELDDILAQLDQKLSA